jgi:plasmid stabilization system protein ParE
MRIRWTPTAAADLQSICDYLKEHEPHLARPTVIEIRSHSLQKMKNPAQAKLERGTLKRS